MFSQLDWRLIYKYTFTFHAYYQWYLHFLTEIADLGWPNTFLIFAVDTLFILYKYSDDLIIFWLKRQNRIFRFHFTNPILLRENVGQGDGEVYPVWGLHQPAGGQVCFSAGLVWIHIGRTRNNASWVGLRGTWSKNTRCTATTWSWSYPSISSQVKRAIKWWQ